MKEAGFTGKMSVLRNLVARNTLIQEQQGEINQRMSTSNSCTIDSDISLDHDLDNINSLKEPSQLQLKNSSQRIA